VELIYTDRALNDVGLVDHMSADFAWGSDENDFEVELSATSGVPPVRGVVYDPTGRVGGVVRGHSVGSDGTLTVTGRTWTGMLGERVLCPPSGSAYFTASGDASEVAEALIAQLGLSSLFSVEGTTGVEVSHTFDGTRDDAQQDAGRYMGGWAAMWQLVWEHGLSLDARWDPEQRRVALSLTERADRTDDESVAALDGQVTWETSTPVNHLVCLGQGEGASRTVVHLYADADGNVSTTQTLTGLDEVAEVYDDSSASTAAELRSHGESRLRNYFAEAGEVGVSINEGAGYALGDLIGGMDERTGTEAEAVVSKKIVTLDGAVASVRYETTVKG